MNSNESKSRESSNRGVQVTSPTGFLASNTKKVVAFSTVAIGVALAIAHQFVLAFVALIALSVMIFYFRKPTELTGPVNGPYPIGADIKKQINKTRYLVNIKKTGEQVGDLYDQLTSEFQQTRKFLDSRFSPSEITYGRYLKSAEEALLATVQYLHESSVLLESLDRISDKEVETQAIAQPDILPLRKKQFEQVGQQITESQKALQILRELNAGLAALSPTALLTETSLDQSIEQLKILAERTHKYERT
jgi:hypothetical protein